MFLEEVAYLTWANHYFPLATFDLGSSGEPTRRAAVISPHEDATLADLTRAVARHTGRPSNEVTLALGASHGIFLAYAALLSPGSSREPADVLVESPVYEPLHRIPQSLGATVRFFERRPEENYALDLERILALVHPRTRVVTVSNLHNPTGVRAPDATLRRLAQGLAERAPEATLLVDEAYASFDTRCDDDGRYLRSARNLGDNVVTTSSLTKTFGYGPERIGWVLANEDRTRAMAHQLTAHLGLLPRSMAPIGVSLFASLATRRDELVSRLPERRALCSAWASSHPALAFHAPSEGLFGFVRVGGASDLRASIERGFREHGVIVAPGSFFGDPSGFRLSWAAPYEKLEESLERLTRALSL
ncbi:MAG: pyridoxal phosphate-dependent aminotransferase [Polyangiaceae bacterium]